MKKQNKKSGKTKNKVQEKFLLETDLPYAGKGKIYTKKEWKRIYGYEVGLLPGVRFIKQD